MLHSDNSVYIRRIVACLYGNKETLFILWLWTPIYDFYLRTWFSAGSMRNGGLNIKVKASFRSYHQSDCSTWTTTMDEVNFR